MPPKAKVTKDDIIGAAVEVVRQNGANAINARNVAAALNCSTQPVFSNFATMEALKLAVVQRADEMCNAYIKREIESGAFPAYKASGMAYIRFAKEEKELFKLLYMRDRSHERGYASSEIGDEMEQMVQCQTGLDGDEMRLFHLEMWAYVHGIASMFATNFIPLDWELVSRMLTDAYQGLCKRHATEG